jgi:hypothetical protein
MGSAPHISIFHIFIVQEQDFRPEAGETVIPAGKLAWIT